MIPVEVSDLPSLAPLPGMDDIDVLLGDVYEDTQLNGNELFETFFGEFSTGPLGLTATEGTTAASAQEHSTIAKERKPKRRKSRKRAIREEKVEDKRPVIHRPCKGVPQPHTTSSWTAVLHH